MDGLISKGTARERQPMRDGEHVMLVAHTAQHVRREHTSERGLMGKIFLAG